jgi:GNAT superfamily N-acetyltransferase
VGDVRLRQEYGIDLDIEALHDRSIHELDKLGPPHGLLLLAMDGAQVAGVAYWRHLDDRGVEIKRMYVLEPFRGRGIGRALLQQLLRQAREAGYSQARLDSARFMKEAHSLCRSAGFREILPYSESEIPPEFHGNWVFMEATL